MAKWEFMVILKGGTTRALTFDGEESAKAALASAHEQADSGGLVNVDGRLCFASSELVLMHISEETSAAFSHEAPAA